MTADVLVLHKLNHWILEGLDRNFRCHHAWQAQDQAKFIAEHGAAARGMACGGHGPVGPALLDKLPKLEMVSVFGVGYDGVDVNACTQRKVRVTNTPDVLTGDVADLALGLAIATLRRIALGDRFVRAGQWLKGALPLYDKLGGKTVGVVGMGRIGQAIARRFAACDTTVVYHGPRKKDVPYRYYPDLAAMAGDCHVLVVACPGGEATRNLVSAKVIAALGKKGYLVNIARGSVVEEPALVQALVEGRLAGAGLDVFVDEPRVPEALMKLDNVVLQPHVGSATTETRKAMADLVVNNLVEHFAGRKLLTPVN
ncbi:MAG: 2-hydroxyacid dehydrogenase [Rhodospirillales bacterium]